MESFLDTWGLTTMVFAPLVGVLAMMFVPEKEEELF